MKIKTLALAMIIASAPAHPKEKITYLNCSTEIIDEPIGRAPTPEMIKHINKDMPDGFNFEDFIDKKGDKKKWKFDINFEQGIGRMPGYTNDTFQTKPGTKSHYLSIGDNLVEFKTANETLSLAINRNTLKVSGWTKGVLMSLHEGACEIVEERAIPKERKF
ncbi:hypothetical protein AB9R84_15695 (plasmid) [Oceanimonas smirnovii]|uniref:hypothetical protein n=1 Tax=Oceanimonas smirnovii TaxID=264574 RepID=UPI003AADA470